MCLSEITRTNIPPEEEITAWKIVLYEVQNAGFASPYREGPQLYTGVWVADTRRIQLPEMREWEPLFPGVIPTFRPLRSYETGFHCFLNREQAFTFMRDVQSELHGTPFERRGFLTPRLRVVRVTLRELTAIGVENRKGSAMPVAVAKSIRVEEVEFDCRRGHTFPPHTPKRLI